MRKISSNKFRQALADRERIFFDGGIGSMLQARGMPAGVSPEAFCLERPDVLFGIHKDYAAAGADVITTNTFQASPYKLPQGVETTDFNRRMAALAREAADQSGRRVFVAGSVGPCGKFLQPMGELEFEALVEAFRAQIRGLVLGGVDLIQIETQIDIAEARAAVIAARRECDLPVSVSMTFEDSLTLTGSTPELCASVLANLGVDVIATNCSAGPEQMADAVDRLLAVSVAPVLVQPNAGLPELVDGKTVFRLAPDRFAELTAVFAQKGAQLLGGCCGTTPDHIRALRRAVEGVPVSQPFHDGCGCVSLSSRTSLVRVGAGQGFTLIGERINPTGKKQLSADLAQGEFGLAFRFADEQLKAGAGILDVNVGAPMVDEEKTLPALVSLLAARYQAPLSLDSSNSKAIEAALAFCPASPLVNSISGEPGRMEFLGPICRDYGAPFVLLPLKGAKLPETAEDRVKILDSLLAEMDALGIPRRLALVDVLVLSVSAKPMAAAECFKFIRYCESLGLPTAAGLSNISFGLPARDLVNSSFLTMAAAHGLNAAIANPGSARIREAVAAVDLLLGRDKDAEKFIAGYSGWSSGTGGGTGSATGGVSSPATGTASPSGGAASLESAVLEGLREDVLPLVEEALNKGEEPFAIVNERLIPAITEVGVRYEKKEYFLPQLLRSAETMQAAFARLRPLLEKDSRSGEKPKVLTATVEGDIHDIGKNIVNLMLGNHGFEVIDLGKDVPAEEIVENAVRHNCSLVGLSALMTTTMVRMRETIDLLRARNISNIKVMVGGAVVTKGFADSIGADGYAADAVEAVRVAKSLLS